MMKSIRSWILVVLASSLLVACGHGGGGSGSTSSWVNLRVYVRNPNKLPSIKYIFNRKTEKGGCDRK